MKEIHMNSKHGNYRMKMMIFLAFKQFKKCLTSWETLRQVILTVVLKSTLWESQDSINVLSDRTKAILNKTSVPLSSRETLPKKTAARDRTRSSRSESKGTWSLNLIWWYLHEMTKAFVAMDRTGRMISETWHGPIVWLSWCIYLSSFMSITVSLSPAPRLRETRRVNDGMMKAGLNDTRAFNLWLTWPFDAWGWSFPPAVFEEWHRPRLILWETFNTLGSGLRGMEPCLSLILCSLMAHFITDSHISRVHHKKTYEPHDLTNTWRTSHVTFCGF